jgi:metal-sulfur cluster biosynthetic enzyme
MATIQDVRERLSEIRPVGEAGDIFALGMVTQLSLDAGRVTMHVQPQKMNPQLLQGLVEEIRRAVGALEGVSQVDVHVPSAQGQSPTASSGRCRALPTSSLCECQGRCRQIDGGGKSRVAAARQRGC